MFDPTPFQQNLSGEETLWLACLIDAFQTLKRYPRSQVQHDFLFGDNDIVDALAEALGSNGDAFRRRMKAALERTRRTRMPQERRTQAG